MKKLLILLFFIPVSLGAQTIITFAGNGIGGVSTEGIPATSSHIPVSGGGVFDREGNFFFTQGLSGQKISRVDVAGIITTIAGTGVSGYNGD